MLNLLTNQSLVVGRPLLGLNLVDVIPCLGLSIVEGHLFLGLVLCWSCTYSWYPLFGVVHC